MDDVRGDATEEMTEGEPEVRRWDEVDGVKYEAGSRDEVMHIKDSRLCPLCATHKEYLLAFIVCQNLVRISAVMLVIL